MLRQALLGIATASALAVSGASLVQRNSGNSTAPTAGTGQSDENANALSGQLGNQSNDKPVRRAGKISPSGGS